MTLATRTPDEADDLRDLGFSVVEVDFSEPRLMRRVFDRADTLCCGPRAPPRAAAAKTQVTAEGARGADTALTPHGAIGCTLEHDLHLFFKRAKPDELLFGAPAARNERIADGLAVITWEGT